MMSEKIYCILCKQEIDQYQKFDDTMLFGGAYYFHESCGYGVINQYLYNEIKKGHIKLDHVTLRGKS